MTKEEVIKLAREAGFESNSLGVTYTSGCLPDLLERFAALVADAERERCVRVVETYRVPVGNSAAGEMAAEWTMDALREIRDAIRGA